MNDLIESKILIRNEIKYPNLDLLYQQQFIDVSLIQPAFHMLQRTVPWVSAEIQIFGKKVLQPRLVAWIADPSILYKYSGLTLPRNNWTPLLLDLKQKIEKISQTSFNSVLLNYYRNGSDSMGWHQDNEKELGENPVIASLSLGCERLFKMKHINPKIKATIALKLQSGDLLVMRGQTQMYWKHSLPKTSRAVGGRINLTFRKIRMTKHS